MVQTSRRTRSTGATRRKVHNHRLLVVVDESSSSKQAVEYLAKALSSRRGFQVCLAHFLSPLPSELLEFGGAGSRPRTATRRPAQDRATTMDCSGQKRGTAGFEMGRTTLRRAGLPASSLTTHFSDPF